MNSHGTNISYTGTNLTGLKARLHVPSTAPFSVPFGNGFHAVLCCCLHITLKKIKVATHRTVTLTIRVNEPKNLQKHSRESRYSWTSPLRLLHHTGSGYEFGYNEQSATTSNFLRIKIGSTAMLKTWATGCKLRGQLCNSQISNVFIQRNSHVFMFIFTLVTWHLTDKKTDSFSISLFSSHGPFSYDIDHFIDHSKRYSRGSAQLK